MSELIETTFVSMLVDDGQVQALASGRVYPATKPSRAAWPNLTYTLIDGHDVGSLGGLSGNGWRTFQVDAWSLSTKEEAAQLAAAAKAVFDRFRGLVGAVRIQAAMVRNLRDADSPPQQADERGVFGSGFDVTIWFETTGS